MREGLKVAASRGVTADPRQGRLARRRSAALAGARARGRAAAARVAVAPARARSTGSPSSGSRSGLGDDRLRARLPEGLHGRHARLADGADARRLRRRDHDARGAGRHRPRAARGRLARRRARDRRPREPQRARRVRGDARRVAAARPAPPHRARAVPAPRRTSAAFAELGVAALGAVLPRALRRGARRPLLGRPARRRLRVPRPARRGRASSNGSDAPIEELDPWAGIVAGVLAALAPGAGVDGRAGARCVDGRAGLADPRRAPARQAPPGYLADLVVLDRDPLAIRPEELPEVQVVATMVGGRWTHNPPPW